MPIKEINMSERLHKTMKSDLLKIDPRRIIVDYDKNPRKEYGDINSLLHYIEENGTKLLTPIKVKPSKDEHGKEIYHLIHGYRRMTAINKLIKKGVEISRVNAIAVPKGYSDKDELIDHISENSGMKLNVMEEADVYNKLIKYGWTQSEIAKRIGKTQGHVSQIIKISNSSDYIKDTIRKGLISSALAIKVMNEHKSNENEAEKIIKASVNKLKISGEKKVTEKNIQVKRISKYKKRFDSAYKTLRNKETPTETLTAFKNKIEPIIKILEENDDPEKLASLLLKMV